MNVKKQWPVLFFVPAALLFLILGVLMEWPWWIIALLVAVPVLAALLIVRLARPRQVRPTDRYEISSEGAHSTGRIELELPLALLEGALSEAVKQVPRLKVRSAGVNTAELEAKMSFKTWGSTISARFEPLDENRTSVVASSRPKVSTTMIDYGQGRDDLRDLFDALERHVAKCTTS